MRFGINNCVHEPCGSKPLSPRPDRKSLKDCHNANSNELIDKVLAWFKESQSNNIMYTYYNEKENKDVYMVALRDGEKNLIGYYEKHEYRNKETKKPYSF